MQPTKALGHGRTMNSTKLAALVEAYPMDMRYQDAGVTNWEYRLATTDTLCNIRMTDLLQLIVVVWTRL
jgi:hypothetical protein